MPRDRSTRLTKRELATVLAALRYWQAALDSNGGPRISEHFFDDVTPLSDDEIDDLCDRLNVMKGH
jgi:hypothetical protein